MFTATPQPLDIQRQTGFTTPLRLLLATTAALWMGAAQPQAATPPAARATTDLRFRQAFTTPGADGDLNLHNMLRQADGQYVGVLGHMVKSERPVPGQFLLKPHRSAALAVMVLLDESQRDWTVPHLPGLVKVRGVLQLPTPDSTDGVTAMIQLPPEPEALRSANVFELSGYVHRLQVAHTTGAGRRHQTGLRTPIAAPAGVKT
jgi:hypothetical protein